MPEKIFVSQQHFFEVDDNGYFQGTLAEGMFGIVMKVQDSQGSPNALKIPRLIYETEYENLSVLSAMEDEVLTCKKVQDSGAIMHLLVPSDTTPPFLKNSRRGDGDNFLIIATKFEIGRTPKFVELTLNREGKILNKRPNIKDFDEKIALDLTKIDQQTTIIHKRVQPPTLSSLDPKRKDLADYLLMDRGDWYVGLPCILYPWAQRSLQQDLLEGKLNNLDFEEILEIIGETIIGITNLHQNEKGVLIHGDLRPANIMTTYSQKNLYSLIDYGNFSQTQQTQTLGRYELPGRYSPFYAPEKRNIDEREDCNFAAIGKINSLFFIILGWESDLSNDKLRTDLFNFVENFDFTIPNPEMLHKNNEAFLLQNQTNGLQERDCIRIRDYIFYVKKEFAIRAKIENKTISLRLIISGEMFLIRGEKIILKRDLEKQGDKYISRFISVPKIVEIKQISIASDMYSIGITTLYMLFLKAFFHKDNENKNISSVNNEFNILVNYVSSYSFITLARDIFDIVNRLKKNHLAGLEPHYGITNQAIKDIVINICSFTPKMSEILSRSLNNNSIHFLLMIDFILRLVHRSSTIDELLAESVEVSASEANSLKQNFFSLNRSQNEPKPISEAQSWLKKVIIPLVAIYSKKSIFEIDDILKYEPKSEIQARIENNIFKRKIENMKKILWLISILLIVMACFLFYTYYQQSTETPHQQSTETPHQQSTEMPHQQGRYALHQYQNIIPAFTAKNGKYILIGSGNLIEGISKTQNIKGN